MSAVLDKDILDTLTDEEREAIESGDLTDSEKEALKAIVGDEDDEDEDEDAGDDNAAPIEGKADQDKPSDKADAATPGDEEPDNKGDDGVADRAFRPIYRADLPEGFADHLSALDAKADDLAQQFKDGEIDFDQYRAESRAIDGEREALNRAKLHAEIYDGMNAQNAEQEWGWTVSRFMRATAKNGGIDYAQDEAKRADLDVFVKALANNPNNAERDFDWFLTEAHKRVQALHDLAPKHGGDKAPPSRKPPLDAAPVTLAQVPGSDGPGDVAGEFADLDGMDGDALELAIARMTPEQRDKYAKGV